MAKRKKRELGFGKAARIYYKRVTILQKYGVKIVPHPGRPKALKTVFKYWKSKGKPKNVEIFIEHTYDFSNVENILKMSPIGKDPGFFEKWWYKKYGKFYEQQRRHDDLKNARIIVKPDYPYLKVKQTRAIWKKWKKKGQPQRMIVKWRVVGDKIKMIWKRRKKK